MLARKAFQHFKKRVDYSEYGGAPLLGVKGVCIICHGGSNPNAIKNAIRVAAEFSAGKVNEKIERELAAASQGNLKVIESLSHRVIESLTVSLNQLHSWIQMKF